MGRHLKRRLTAAFPRLDGPFRMIFRVLDPFINLPVPHGRMDASPGGACVLPPSNPGDSSNDQDDDDEDPYQETADAAHAFIND